MPVVSRHPFNVLLHCFASVDSLRSRPRRRRRQCGRFKPCGSATCLSAATWTASKTHVRAGAACGTEWVWGQGRAGGTCERPLPPPSNHVRPLQQWPLGWFCTGPTAIRGRPRALSFVLDHANHPSSCPPLHAAPYSDEVLETYNAAWSNALIQRGYAMDTNASAFTTVEVRACSCIRSLGQSCIHRSFMRRPTALAATRACSPQMR